MSFRCGPSFNDCHRYLMQLTLHSTHKNCNSSSMNHKRQVKDSFGKFQTRRKNLHVTFAIVCKCFPNTRVYIRNATPLQTHKCAVCTHTQAVYTLNKTFYIYRIHSHTLHLVLSEIRLLEPDLLQLNFTYRMKPNCGTKNMESIFLGEIEFIPRDKVKNHSNWFSPNFSSFDRSIYIRQFIQLKAFNIELKSECITTLL